MTKQLNEMTDAEFFIQGAKVVEHLTSLLNTAHQQMAEAFRREPNERSASAMVHHGLYHTMDGLATICDNQELFDEEATEWVSSILVESRRRHRKYWGEEE